jgi:hypothetical protein
VTASSAPVKGGAPTAGRTSNCRAMGGAPSPIATAGTSPGGGTDGMRAA